MGNKQKQTFMFAVLEGVGHLNACIGIGQQLLKRGHRVTFITPNNWKGMLIPLGFEEELFENESVAPVPKGKWSEMIGAMAPGLALPPFLQIENLYPPLFQELLRVTKEADSKVREIVAKVKPDVIVVDHVLQMPALMDQGIPWIFSTSLCPLVTLLSDDMPPPYSGYSVTERNTAKWQQFVEKYKAVNCKAFAEFSSWVVEHGGPQLTLEGPLWLNYSPYANICMYPRELMYDSFDGNRGNWHRFDAFMREAEGTFEIPAKIKDLPGNLIYFSMGTLGSSELGLMRKLIGILAKSPHRFIAAKGPVGDELEMPDNMWGDNNVPQTLILPLVDLVITHGGNNTVTESFYFGKPCIVLPLCSDAHDNATRIAETGLGLQFPPYDVTEEQLLSSIELILKDKLLKNRMNTIGARIRTTNCQSRAADVVESVAFKNE